MFLAWVLLIACQDLTKVIAREGCSAVLVGVSRQRQEDQEQFFARIAELFHCEIVLLN